MAGFAELMQLLENDIPECRRHLKDSHANLEKVASYCEGNYLQASDKRQALEETKNYTTQSLASVAYQINMLATNFLHLLDLQTVQISDMESSINHLSQIVMIHKEKVARREIGELTTNKATTKLPGVKNPGIIFPEKPEIQVKYIRKPIDYSILDGIGHGVKPAQQQQGAHMRSGSNVGTLRGSVISTSSSTGQAPTSHPPTPPASMYAAGTGTLRSSSSPYRTPAPPVNPPSVPSLGYAPNQPLSGSGAMGRESGYAAGSTAMMSTPPVRMVQPLQQQSSMYAGASPLPPPMHDISQRPYISDPILLSDTTSMYRTSQQLGNVSPPLPPPPGSDVDDRFSIMQSRAFDPKYTVGASGSVDYGADYQHDNYNSRRSRLDDDEEDWIPESYLEKVVAIYSYQQDKEDELTFDEGAVIYVVKKNDDGWWEGVMDGHTGLFPGNYVEPCI
jgi:hypothetical protein